MIIDTDRNGNTRYRSTGNIKIEPGYWEKLLHQYAGMAMQGILANLGNTISPDYIVEEAEAYAAALVEKLKSNSYDK